MKLYKRKGKLGTQGHRDEIHNMGRNHQAWELLTVLRITVVVQRNKSHSKEGKCIYSKDTISKLWEGIVLLISPLVRPRLEPHVFFWA